MKTVLYRRAWDEPRDHRSEFTLYSHGIREKMPPGMLQYRCGIDDWLLIYFHDSARAENREIRPGDLMVWKPGATREYGNADQSWTHSWLQVTGKRVAPILQECSIKTASPWPAGPAPLIEHGLQQLHAELGAVSEISTRILGNLFENWLLGLARNRLEPDAPREKRLRVLKHHLDTSTSTPMSLDEMAHYAGLSSSHLSALFLHTYGTPPAAYHVERRIETAKFLLAQRGRSVTEVAEQTGYPELASFSRAFKRIVGVSPRQFTLSNSRSDPASVAS